MTEDHIAKPDNAATTAPGATASGSSAAFAKSAADTLQKSGDSLNRYFMTWSDVWRERTADMMKAGSLWGQLAGELGEAYYSTCNELYARFAKFSQQAAACHSPTDLVNLETEGVNVMTEVSESASKLYGKAWSTFSKDVVPLIQRAAATPERVMETQAR